MSKLNKKILVTGGAGFVGGHFCELALEKGYDVVIIDVFNDETSSPQEKSFNIKCIKDTAENNKAKLKIYPCSITDEVALNKIFIDEQPNIPTKYGVRGIPTMLLFKNGELKATKVGATTKSNIVSWIKENI